MAEIDPNKIDMPRFDHYIGTFQVSIDAYDLEYVPSLFAFDMLDILIYLSIRNGYYLPV